MDNKAVKVSVVMPVYNAAKFVRESIESVLAQSFCDYELLLIDDCSTDNSLEILLEYEQKDSRVKVLKNELNSGVSHTRNVGVKNACGEYIAFLDSDDMWTSDKLEKQIDLIYKYPDTDICYTDSAFIDIEGNRSDYIFTVPQSITYKELLKQNVISCSSVLAKKDVIKKYPMIHDHMHEDFAVWLQVLKSGGIARAVNEPLLIYRINRKSKSGNKFKSLGMGYKVYKFMGLNYFQRNYYMVHYIIRGIKKYSSI